MFTQPPRCPNPACPHHTDGAKGFYTRKGSYRTKHDHQLVRRYRCKECRRWFNSRTFSPTAGQHKPDVNGQIMDLICSGVTMRRAARIVGVAKKTIERKVRWLADQSRKAHDRFLADPPERTSYIQMDEMETYEHAKLKPLSIALAVRYKTGRILGAKIATMNCHGKMAPISRKFYGVRLDTRADAFKAVLGNVAKVAKAGITVATDGKDAYVPMIRKVVPGAIHAIHVRPKRPRETTAAPTSVPNPPSAPGSAPPTKPWDPLYRLNQTAAKLRADISRLARKTWSASKCAAGLDDHLAIYVAFNNGYALA